MTQTNWTLSQLEALGTEQLQNVTAIACTASCTSRLLFGRCLVAIDRTGLASHVGCSGSIHYAIHLGTDKRDALEMRRVARELERLPVLREAAEHGEVGWSSMREIVRKASPETEGRWLELARANSYKTIERIVRRTRAGDAPSESNLDERDPVEADLRVTLPMEQMQLWNQAVRELCARAGRRLAMAEVLECLCLELLSGAAFPPDDVRRRVYDELARDAAADDEAEQREVVEACEPARVDTPWEAVEADTEVCCSDPQLTLVKPWQNPRLHFSADNRLATPAQRREILRRDAYCCANPGCPFHLWLQVHHISFYFDGGATLPENLLTLCSRCHKNLHLGLLTVSGLAPGRLVWTDRFGLAPGLRFRNLLGRRLGLMVPEPARILLRRSNGTVLGLAADR